MKIALINPPDSLSYETMPSPEFYGFRLGLGYIAAYVQKAGHTVKMFDPEPAKMPLERMWEEVKGFSPDIIGFTAVTKNFMVARQLAAEAKRRQGCPVIMGGPHATALPRSTLLAVQGLDAVVLGEGELPMLALATEFDASGRVDFSKMPGAAFLENGVYREVPRLPVIEDLDSVPYPARELVDLSLYQRMYRSPTLKMASLISSRGCPSQCTFCANICMGRKFRAHSPAYVVGEMAVLVEKYGVNHIRFVDDCFTVDPVRVSAICDLIMAKRWNLTWDVAGRVNTLLDDELIKKMKRAGCLSVMLGVESGNRKIAATMKKGTTPEMAEACCEKLNRNGMAHIDSFIIGNEEETLRTALDTISFSKKLKSVTVFFNMLIPYPGTALFEKYYKDYDRPDTDWTYWCIQGPGRPYTPRQTSLSGRMIMWLSLLGYVRYYLDPFQMLRILNFSFERQRVRAERKRIHARRERAAA